MHKVIHHTHYALAGKHTNGMGGGGGVPTCKIDLFFILFGFLSNKNGNTIFGKHFMVLSCLSLFFERRETLASRFLGSAERPCENSKLDRLYESLRRLIYKNPYPIPILCMRFIKTGNKDV